MKKLITSLLAVVLGTSNLYTSEYTLVQAKNAQSEQVLNEAKKENNHNEKNLALHAPVRASKYLPEANGVPARRPEGAVDGISGNQTDAEQNSRWQSGEDSKFSEQWLEVDLGGTSLISQVNVKFFAKLYGNFIIETSNENHDQATWKTIQTVNVPSGTEMDLIRPVDLKKEGKPIEVSRYLRLRFTSGNANAANRSIGVREFEVMGTKKSEDGYETVTGNIALGKKVTASGVEAGAEHCKPEFVVDGKKTEDSRWSAPQMKTGSNPNQQQTAQWLEIDLRNEVTDITKVELSFFKRVYSIDYEIQTRPDKKTAWKTVKHMTRESLTDQNPVDTIKDIPRLDRYVKFVFHKVNPQAAGVSVSLFEIEINGTQVQTPDVVNPSPETAQEAMQAVTALDAITQDSKTVPLPKMPEGYEIHVKGSEFPQVISDDGKISSHNMYDYQMEIILEVTNKNNPKDKAEKSFQVRVPNKRAKNSTLFPKLENQNQEPKVIPSIQEWYGYQGDVKLTKDSKIILKDAANIGLDQVAKQFQTDMKQITGWTFEIVHNQKAKANDIVIESLAKDTYDTGKEGYLLTANEEGIHILSNGYNGCFYGTVTLEQVFYRQKGEYTFPKGVIRDFSKYEVRGVMIDVARTPYRLDALKDIVKTLSFYKINEVHFHLNDNRHIATGGNRGDYEYWKNSEAMFRLQSEKFPSLKTDRKNDEYYNKEFGGSPQYTKEEYRNLQAYASNYGMNSISEIDAPGHSLLFTKYVKNHLDEVKKVLPEINGTIHNRRDWELLSLTGKEGEWSTQFMKTLFGEYLEGENPVFMGDTVHIGVDEYWGIQNNEYQGMRNYIREMADTVKENGKKVRMWGSMVNYFDNKGISTKDYNDIEIDYWTKDWENAAKRSREGFKIVNVDSFNLYGNPGRDKRDIVNVEHVFNDWSPNVIHGGESLKKADPNLLGAKTALWADVSDMGVTERDNYERIMRQAAILSEKTWGGTDAGQDFEEYSFKYESLQAGPGVTLASNIPSKTGLVLDYDFNNVKDQVVYDGSGNAYNGSIQGGIVKEQDGKAWLELDGQTAIKTGLQSIDYPYTVQFDLQLGKENGEELPLFDSKDGRLTLQKDGNLGLRRSYFNQSFNYKVALNQPVNVTIVGTQQVTKLYINGKLEKVLSRTRAAENDYEHLLSTFVFPLTTIGKGLHGKLADIKVYDKALSPQIIQDLSQGKIVQEVNVAQGQAASGVAQKKGEGNYDIDWKKLRVGWKAIDGDGNALDGSHTSDVSEKDSYFEGGHNDSTFAVDMRDTYDISKVVLQWDKAPIKFKLQTSQNGKVWTDLQTINGENENVIQFNQPLSTQYLRVQGIQNNGSSFKLREFEAYETVDKGMLKKLLEEASLKIDENKLTFENSKEYASFYQAYVEAKAMYESALSKKKDITSTINQLRNELAKLPEKPEKVEVTEIEVKVEKDTLHVGESVKATVIVKPANATNPTVMWKTTNPEVLAVSKDGTITAKKAGTATIIATTANGKKAEVKITVIKEETEKPVEVEVTKVEIQVEKDTLHVGESTKATATIKPANATNSTVMWETTNPEVLAISKDGTITAKKAGTATIIATTANGKKAELEITVLANESENMNPEKPNMNKPDSNIHKPNKEELNNDQSKDTVHTGVHTNEVTYIVLMMIAGMIVFGYRRRFLK